VKVIVMCPESQDSLKAIHSARIPSEASVPPCIWYHSHHLYQLGNLSVLYTIMEASGLG
jgi:hypothetical protein